MPLAPLESGGQIIISELGPPQYFSASYAYDYTKLQIHCQL